jgi:hypothetical protein
MMTMADEPNAGAANAAGGNDGNAAAANAAAANAGNDPWYAKADYGFDQETRDYLGSKDFKAPVDAVKSLRHFETLARDRNAIQLPAAGQETQWDGWEKLGWSKDPTKYEVKAPAEQVKEGEEPIYDRNFHDSLVKTMHEARVPAPAAQKIIDSMFDYVKTSIDAAQTEAANQRTALENGLKKEWGNDFKANKDLASRAMRALGVDKEQGIELNTLLGNPATVKLFHKIGSMLAEDKLVNSDGNGSGGKSPATARAERLALQQSPEFKAAFQDPRHPQHEAMKQRRNALLELEAKG